jgi:hypothetical protein
MPPRIDNPRSYRWTAADLALLAECRRLRGLTETDTIREALKEVLPRWRKRAAEIAPKNPDNGA